jgi:hypothetical protein
MTFLLMIAIGNVVHVIVSNITDRVGVLRYVRSYVRSYFRLMCLRFVLLPVIAFVVNRA